VSEYLVDSVEEDNNPVEERWRHLSYSVSKATIEVLGVQNMGRKTEHWFDSKCKAAMDGKTKAYGLIQQRKYTEDGRQYGDGITGGGTQNAAGQKVL
jgi:hypothetical protein